MKYFSVFIIITGIFLITNLLYSDTIILKDNKELKGLVVEEYVDRIILSTIDGEKSVFREDIEKIIYDTPEQNFMKLGKLYEDRLLYEKAAFYYKKALEANPDYKDAREALVSIKAKLWHHKDHMTKKAVSHQKMVMDWRKTRKEKLTKEKKDKLTLLKHSLGITLLKEDGFFKVDTVEPYSSADKSGIKRGDIVLSIWGKLIRYWNMEDVFRELLGPSHSEVNITIEKEILFKDSDLINLDKIYDILGIHLEFVYKGLIIKEIDKEALGRKYGLKENDYIVSINNTKTRYLSIDKIINLINDSKGEKLSFSINRKINLRREQ